MTADRARELTTAKVDRIAAAAGMPRQIVAAELDRLERQLRNEVAPAVALESIGRECSESLAAAIKAEMSRPGPSAGEIAAEAAALVSRQEAVRKAGEWRTGPPERFRK